MGFTRGTVKRRFILSKTKRFSNWGQLGYCRYVIWIKTPNNDLPKADFPAKSDLIIQPSVSPEALAAMLYES